MGTTGVIFAAIAIAWLAYLVPQFVRKRDDEMPVPVDIDASKRFSADVRVVAGAEVAATEEADEPQVYKVSTPKSRGRQVEELRRLERDAARRRRRVLLGLASLTSLVVGMCGAGLLPWVAASVPGGLIVLFALVARLSVRAMHRGLETRYAAIMGGSNEPTMTLRAPARAKKAGKAAAAVAGESGSERGSLWDPLPITLPTYVSRPLAPRTVRTIDLSGASIGAGVPVTAEARETVAPAAVPRGPSERDEPEAASA